MHVASPGLTAGRGLKRILGRIVAIDLGASPGLTAGRGLKRDHAAGSGDRMMASPGGSGLKQADAQRGKHVQLHQASTDRNAQPVATCLHSSHYLPWNKFLSKGYDFWASGKALG